MYENIGLFLIPIVVFIIAFISYVMLASKVYERKIKKLKDMAPNVTDLILDNLKEIREQQDKMYNRINALEISVAQMKVKFGILGTLIGAVSSAITTWIIILLKGI